MIELAMIACAGLLGSSHCVGMCGGFALTVGLDSRSWLENLGRQLSYSAGRAFCYAGLGGIVAVGGAQLGTSNLLWGQLPALLSVVAGAVLVWQGLLAAGVRLLPQSQRHGVLAKLFCPAGATFGSILRAPGYASRFVAGVLTGFLPCGLLYGFLALAASTGDMLSGMAVMSAFALGTVPLMVVTGVGSGGLGLAGRRRMLRIAAWCVVATGLLTVSRGVAAVRFDGTSERPLCPVCVEFGE